MRCAFYAIKLYTQSKCSLFGFYILPPPLYDSNTKFACDSPKQVWRGWISWSEGSPRKHANWTTVANFQIWSLIIEKFFFSKNQLNIVEIFCHAETFGGNVLPFTCTRVTTATYYRSSTAVYMCYRCQI